MGIMARHQGELVVITSDRNAEDPTGKRAAKKLSNTYEVWTGDKWSADMTIAKTFLTIDAADEYVRANYTQVMA